MVQELTVECPHCHQVAEIYLSTNACVIILNCPSCSSPIMYFDQKIFILTPYQLEAIKNKTRSSSMNTLRNMIKSEQLPVKKNSIKTSENTYIPRFAPVQRSSASLTANTRKIYIGSDDITNLKIDLAICRDVQEFVDTI